MGAESLAPALRQHELGRGTRLFNALAVLLPPIALVCAAALSWGALIDATALAIFLVMYLATTLGVTMGFHRLLTHRSFETYRPIRVLLAVLGSMAVEGPPIVWVADHRKHHAFADEQGDPHSPHTHGGPGTRATLEGLYHAHLGWLLSRREPSDPLRYARDLVRDRDLRRVSELFPAIVALGLVLPTAAGALLTDSLTGALTGLLWGGVARIFVVHHLTWSVNSLGHYLGRRRFATRDHSGNLACLALLSLGDSWHHNHHAFPRSARHGLRWWELDPTGALIGSLAKLGLVWNVVSVSAERQRELEARR